MIEIELDFKDIESAEELVLYVKYQYGSGVEYTLKLCYTTNKRR